MNEATKRIMTGALLLACVGGFRLLGSRPVAEPAPAPISLSAAAPDVPLTPAAAQRPAASQSAPAQEPLKAESFDLAALKARGLPLLLVFGAPGCSYCQQMLPELEKLRETLSGKAIVQYIDLARFPEATKEFPVPSTPALIFFDAAGNSYKPSAADAQGFIDYGAYSVLIGKTDEARMLKIFADMGVTPA